MQLRARRQRFAATIGSLRPGSSGSVLGDRPTIPVPRPRRQLGSDEIERTPLGVMHLRDLATQVDEKSTQRGAARRDATSRRLLGLADVIGAAVALFLAQVIAGVDALPLYIYLGIPVVVVISKAIGLYDRDELVIAKTTLTEAPALFQLATLYTLLITIVTQASGETLNPNAIVVLWAFLFVGVLCSRTVARRMARSLTPPEYCLVLGSSSQATGAQSKFACHDGLHARIVAYLPFEQFELSRPRPDSFARYIAERGIQRVIIASGDSHERVVEAVRYFKARELKVSILPSLLEAVGTSVEFDEVHGTTFLGVRTFGLTRSSAVLKRALDVVGAAALLVLLSPLLIAMAIAVRLESRGPVLFKQTRVGRDGGHFTMLKFRTMSEGAEETRSMLDDLNETAGLFKVADDPRITRVGRALRHSSLDELPQLVNVLRGEMSLVGPRPLVVDEDARVRGWHRNRLHLKPGMTGAWQIIGDARVPLEEMAIMDYLYIVNWSPWSDAKILLQTLQHVLGRRGL